MDVRVELYLRDRVIAGVLSPYTGRALELFNDPRQDALILQDVSDESLYPTAAPRAYAAARVQLANVLLAVPHDDASMLDGFMRGWWIEKLTRRVELVIGPFTIIGILHHWLREPCTLQEIGQIPDQRVFVPVTEASLQSLYQPSWSAACATIFVRRAAIDAISLVAEAAPVTASGDLEAEMERWRNSVLQDR